MNARKRFYSLIAIMAVIVLAVEAIAIGFLYDAALREERARLEETAKSQARLIEAVARFDRVYSNDYPQGAREATIDQIRDAHSKYGGFGATGEFMLATRMNDQIVFLLAHYHAGLNEPRPVPWDSGLAEPMRLALSGKSGTIIGIDHEGVKVLAAYEPVAELNLGIVAKMDLAEIRAPFVNAAVISGFCAIVLIGLGAGLFHRITDPILQGLNNTVEKLRRALDELKIMERIRSRTEKMAHIGSWHLDIGTGKLIWSDEVYHIFGLQPQTFDATYDSFLAAVHPGDRELVDSAYRKAIEEKTPYEVVHRIVRPDGEVRTVHEKSEDIADGSGKTVHSFGMVHDITEARKQEEEREKLIAELQRSLSEIRTLRGIIPICSFCKKVRDDKGYWDQVEVFVREHTEADFSHGVCPACAEKHYAKYLNRPK